MKTNTHLLLYLAHYFLEWEIFQTNIVEKIKTHVLCSVNFFFFENRAFYEITWKDTEEPDRPQTAIWRLHMVCFLPKATNKHSEYVILIAFLPQESTSMLR